MSWPEGNIMICRTDAIGDVVLTLPLSGYLKKIMPDKKVFFLGRTYTKPIIESCKNVDEFLNWDEIQHKEEKEIISLWGKWNIGIVLFVFPDKNISRLAKKAKIAHRVGTAHRWFHWLYCNHLPFFSRRKSDLHEAQLNFQLIKPFEEPSFFSLEKLYSLTGMEQKFELPYWVKEHFNKEKFHLILHPRSKGSSREWGISNFEKLIQLLPTERFTIYITGTKQEGESMPGLLKDLPDHVIDLSGKLSLEELISLIQTCDGMVACSTGPLHICAVSGKHAIGLYPPMRPLHPGRWKPIGPEVKIFSIDKNCNDCRNGGNCPCIENIRPNEVAEYLIGLTEETKIQTINI
ncbi:MAG: glycosyltransferase family 9 protein [Saprospiraceae bacterium]|nr:glycosyltransferase family 9 protein [Saprospiraceae bacterium]